MRERLADISARIGGVHQLDAVVNAMRGIAAARVQQARAQIAAVDGYTATLTAAMGRIVATGASHGDELPARMPARPRPALVAFCAEQGFAGTFSERILDAIAADIGHAEIFLIGARGQSLATERDISPAWSRPLPAHSPAIPKLADRICETIFERIDKGALDRLDVVFTTGETGQARIVRRTLFPVDLSAIAPSPARLPPLANLPPADLLETIGEDYVHALLCNAALHSFVAENEARITAMALARSQIESELADLQARERHIRQEAITAEIIELAAGELASRDADTRI